MDPSKDKIHFDYSRSLQTFLAGRMLPSSATAMPIGAQSRPCRSKHLQIAGIIE
jgi:hypothetical protein